MASKAESHCHIQQKQEVSFKQWKLRASNLFPGYIPAVLYYLMLLIPVDRMDRVSEGASALSEFAFSLQLARIGPDGERGKAKQAQHAARRCWPLQRNPFIALMSVKMPDGRYTQKQACSPKVPLCGFVLLPPWLSALRAERLV